MIKCKYYKEMLISVIGCQAVFETKYGCGLRNKPVECQGDKTQCWYPELLHEKECALLKKVVDKEL